MTQSVRASSCSGRWCTLQVRAHGGTCGPQTEHPVGGGSNWVLGGMAVSGAEPGHQWHLACGLIVGSRSEPHSERSAHADLWPGCDGASGRDRDRVLLSSRGDHAQ